MTRGGPPVWLGLLGPSLLFTLPITIAMIAASSYWAVGSIAVMGGLHWIAVKHPPYLYVKPL